MFGSQAAARSAFVLILVLGGTTWAAWQHQGGTDRATNTANGAGAISDAAAELPGVSWSVGIGGADFSADLLHDTDGDGVPEVITGFRGALTAYDILDGSGVWTSPGSSVTHVVGVYDVNGDGVEGEIVAIGRGMGGGIEIVDAATGSSLWSFSDLEGASGVQPSEITVADLDGLPGEELVFSGFVHTNELLVASLAGASGPEVVSVDLNGDYVVVNRTVVADFDGDGAAGEIAVFQGRDIDTFELCDASDAGAVCSDVGTLCLCHAGLAVDLFPSLALPQNPSSFDGDGDGDDDLLIVQTHNTQSRGVGLLDLEPIFSGTGVVGGWLHDYADNTDDTVPRSPVGATDLDGDGEDEILVSVFNTRQDELGLDGGPGDDGLNHPGGFETAVFAGADGALVDSIPDAYVLGLVDLDADGVDEAVVHTTADWSYTGGGLQGWELVCDPDCAFELAWERPESGGIRFPESYDDAGFPSQVLRTFGEPATTLLGWAGDDLQALEPDGAGGLTVAASITLAEEDDVVGVHAASGHLLVSSAAGLDVYDAGLTLIATLTDAFSEEPPLWLAAAAQSADARAVPVIAGHVFTSELSPSSLDDADSTVLANVVVMRDVDGDGFTDIYSWEVDDVLGDLVVARHEFGVFTAPDEVWTWVADDADLDGYAPRNNWPAVAEDYDGDGVEDLMFGVQKQGGVGMFLLDGASGDPQWIGEGTCCKSIVQPLLPVDIIGPGQVYGLQDGLVDVVRPTRSHIDVWEVGEASHHTRQAWAGGVVGSTAIGDIDGDGGVDIFAANLANTTEPMFEAWSLLPDMMLRWGPVPSPLLPPDTEQALAVADVDGVAGDDLVFVSSDSAIGGLSGLTGLALSGFPYYLAGGEQVTEAPRDREPLTAILLADLDGDGFREAIAGSREGWLYGVDIEAGEPSAGLQWSFFLGAPVVQLGAADVDGDGEIELLASTRDGHVRAIDGLGVDIAIESPLAEDCVEGAEIEISGTSTGIEAVQVAVLGVPVGTEVTPDASGDWSVVVEVPLLEGTVSVLAQGLVGGTVAASSVLEITSRSDLDDDGATVCGGDCDDAEPAMFPGNPEVCDGLDNDCDTATDEEADGDGDGESLCDGDCDDADPDRFAGAEEVCDDGIDNDCDDATDDADTDCGAEPTPTPQPTPEPTPGDVDPGGGCLGCGGDGDPACAQAGSEGRTGLALIVLLGLLRRRRRD